MVVAVVAVRVVEVTRDEIVDMVAVGHGLVAAGRTMHVAGLVAGAAMRRGAGFGVLRVGLDDMLVDMVAVRMVQMPVMKIVDVTLVADRGVTAARAMLMGMPGMGRLATSRHD